MKKRNSDSLVHLIVIPEEVLQHITFPVVRITLTDCQGRNVTWDGELAITKEIVRDSSKAKTTSFPMFRCFKREVSEDVSDRIMKHFTEVE